MDYSANYNAQDVQDNKVMALLSYIGILFLVPKLARKESPYAQFHANQGGNLFIIGVIVNIIIWVISFVIGLGLGLTGSGIFSVLATIVGIISWVVGVVFLILMVLGIVYALQGKAKELPIVGKVKFLK